MSARLRMARRTILRTVMAALTRGSTSGTRLEKLRYMFGDVGFNRLYCDGEGTATTHLVGECFHLRLQSPRVVKRDAFHTIEPPCRTEQVEIEDRQGPSD